MLEKREQNIFRLEDPTERNTFFREAYKCLCGIKCTMTKQDDGALSSVEVVELEGENEEKYVIKINDYIRASRVFEETQVQDETMCSFKDFDARAKREIAFLLNLKNEKFSEADKYRIITSRNNTQEGVENIIEIIGYGKIDCGDFIKRRGENGSEIPVPADDSYNAIPFRFYEMPFLECINKSLFSLKNALSLGVDISNALCYIHSDSSLEGGCHGDIKINNILYKKTINNKYDPYSYILTDFNTLHREMRRSRGTMESGTPVTMAPEMFSKNGKDPIYSYTADHYSLAATIYYMLNGGQYPIEKKIGKEVIKPYSYPGFATHIYVSPRDDKSKEKVIKLLKIKYGFGNREAIKAAEIYLFVTKQLEDEKCDRSIYIYEGETEVKCTRRVKYSYLYFLKELGEACFKDKNYDRALEYYGRYISRQERELQYCKMDNERKGEIEKVSCDLNLAKYNMGLALIRSDINEDYDKVTELVEELGDLLYEKGLENAFEYGIYLASPENEDFHVLMECMDREKDKSGNYRVFYDKEKWDILTLAFQALQEVDEDSKERDHEILKTLLRDLPVDVELPNSIKTSINRLAEKVSYTVKYEVEKHPELAPDDKRYTAYYLKNEKYVENVDLDSKVVGYKVDEEHSSYPKEGDLLKDGAEYVIKYVKDPGQTKKIKFMVRYQCNGTVFFSEDKECDLWIKDEMHYDESLDKIPEQFADAYLFKSVNKERGSVISDGEEIFVDCEKKYISTEYTVKHIRDGQEVLEDTASFKSRCWTGENTKTVTLAKEALQPHTYNGYEYFKILPENAAAGNTLEDHAEIQLLYRKDSDAEKTVFYAVTYYKDGEECDSVIQRNRVWAGTADRLEIQSGAIGAERYDGYLLDHVEPDVKEGDEISSGSLINVYFVKNPEVQDGFEIEDNTLIRYTGKAKQIVIPNGIEVIGPGAFSAYKELKGVEFPESLKTIGNSAFINCSSLAEVKFSEGLRTIGLGAFYGCNSLNSIEFPASLQYIGSRAFGNCTALKGTICLPETMVQVYKDAFEGCPSIGRVEQSQAVSFLELEDNVDGKCETKKNQLLEEKNATDFIIEGSTLTKYIGNDSHVVIPNGVDTIGAHAFENNKTLETIEFPDSLRFIEFCAFKKCTKLKGSLSFPCTLTDIGPLAFSNCDLIEKIVFPEALKSIGAYAFCLCESLQGIISIPHSVIEIGENAFSGCNNIELVILDRLPKSMGEDAFGSCQCLLDGNFYIENRTLIGYKEENANVVIPEGIEIIGAGAFRANNIVKTLVFPTTVLEIGKRAFKDCTSIEGVISLPESLMRIGEAAFSGCDSIEKIELPTYLKYIEDLAFYRCKSIKGIVEIPESVVSIGEDAFNECISIELIVVPEGVKEINEDAFHSCPTMSKSEYIDFKEDNNSYDKLTRDIRSLIKTYYIVEHIKLDDNRNETCVSKKTYTSTSWAGNEEAQIIIERNSLAHKKIEGYSYFNINSDIGVVYEGAYVP